MQSNELQYLATMFSVHYSRCGTYMQRAGGTNLQRGRGASGCSAVDKNLIAVFVLRKRQSRSSHCPFCLPALLAFTTTTFRCPVCMYTWFIPTRKYTLRHRLYGLAATGRATRGSWGWARGNPVTPGQTNAKANKSATLTCRSPPFRLFYLFYYIYYILFGK